MSEQGIPREHLIKMIALQKQTMSELYEKNAELKKDVALLAQGLDDALYALLCKKRYQYEYLDENLSRLEHLIVKYGKKGE